MIHLVILTTSVRQSGGVGASNAIKMAAFVSQIPRPLQTNGQEEVSVEVTKGRVDEKKNDDEAGHKWEKRL